MNITTSFTISDWIVFFFCLSLTYFVVWLGQRKKDEHIANNESSSFLDHLLMGRKLTLPMFVATLVATWYGGIFGVTQIAFEKGLFNFLTQGIFWYATYIIFALFFAKKVRESGAITLPDLVGKIFGKKSSRLSALLNFFNILPITYVISVGLFIQFFTNGSLFQSMLLGTSLVIIYSLYGGFRAVVFSDLVQFFLMCSSVFFVLVLSIQKFGGWSFLQSNLPQNHLSLTGGESLSTIFVWGFIALSTLVDPNFYHRCFAAASTKTAQKGIFISTLIWICFDICTTFGALYARAHMPEADSNLAYLQYGMTILPHGLKGLFAAGILATIFSTLDSYLFLAGTSISVDLLPKKHRFNKKLHHLAVIFSAFLAFSLALIFDGNIKSVWKSLGSLSAGSLLLPLALSQLKLIKLTDNQFFVTCLCSAFGMFLWKIKISASLNLKIDTLYIGILISGLCILISQLRSRH